MIALSDHADGVVLPVRAQPRARRNAIVGEHAGSLRVAVTAPPEDGRANAAVVELLAESLQVKRSQIELLSGATSRSKAFLLRGISSAELAARIKSLIGK